MQQAEHETAMKGEKSIYLEILKNIFSLQASHEFISVLLPKRDDECEEITL